MGKKLTLSAIEKENKKYKEQFKVEVNGYELMVDKYFSPKKMNNLIEQLRKTAEYINKNEEIDEEKFDFISYSLLLMIKYFTNLEIPDELSQELFVLEQLIEGEFFIGIINELPEQEVKKLEEKIKVYTDGLQKFIADIKDNEVMLDA